MLGRVGRVGVKALAAAVDPFYGPFPGPRILIYHQVGVSMGREMEVSTDTFRRHVDWMQADGEIVDLETAIERRGEPHAARFFVLTFDDGFEDVYHNAFPLMKERGAPFTLYLTTRPIETCQPIDPRYSMARPLTWNQVNEMTGTGLVTVGAHTHTHLDLRMATAQQVIDELDTSNELIAERTGVMPRHFTYPWGWWSQTADPLVRARYATATVGSGEPITADTDPTRLHRLPVQASDHMALFRRRLRGGFRLEDRLRRRVAGYRGP